MLLQTLSEPTGDGFHFESTVKAHGWAVLSPFHWDAERTELSRIHRLPDDTVVRLCLQESGVPVPAVAITVETPIPLGQEHDREIRRAVRRMLRLDEDFSDFHQLRAAMNGWTLQLHAKGGRLLRCPTLFEDMVYTLCTTNITWSGTKRLVRLLTEKLGSPFLGDADQRAFPTPATIAAAGPDYLRQEVGMGYRSTYLWELATAVAEGSLDLDQLENPALSTEELLRTLLEIKGIGRYAAATILMLLGRYEHLAIDTELRAFVTKKYFNGESPSEAEMKAVYEPWGRWRYLAYWFDTPAADG